MKEHVAPIVESLGPVAVAVPGPAPPAPAPRRLLLGAVFYLHVAAGYFAVSTWPDWQHHGVASGSVVSTLFAGAGLAIGVSRVRAYRRARADRVG